MSTSLHDLPSAAAIARALSPATLTASGTGSAVDLGAGDGPCFAVQVVGSVSDGVSIAGRIEQSADGTTWDAIPGATFDAVGASNAIQVIGFTRTARYVRWAATITGSDPEIVAAAIIGQQKKTF